MAKHGHIPPRTRNSSRAAHAERGPRGRQFFHNRNDGNDPLRFFHKMFGGGAPSEAGWLKERRQRWSQRIRAQRSGLVLPARGGHGG